MVWFVVGLLALVLVAIGVGVYCVSIYNGLVGVKHQVEQAWVEHRRPVAPAA